MGRRLIPAIALLAPVSNPAHAAAAPATPSHATASPLSTSSPGQIPAPAAKEKGNPYGRPIDLTVDVQFYNRDLGEVTLHMAADGSTTVDGTGMTAVLKPLLSDAGLAKVNPLLAGRGTVRLSDLKPVGIDAVFDRENVAITISAIDPRLRKPLSLYAQPNDELERQTNASPAGFSAFLDATISQSRLWGGPNPGFEDPALFFDTAVRAGPIVFEGEAQIADRDPFAADRQYRFDRNYLRLVYDIPDDYLRMYLGDLTPDVRFDQDFVQMGGFGISRERERFDQFRSAILQGNRQLILQRQSTVDIYRNGILFQQLQLEPGSYDLNNLPLISGSNDIRLAVHDASGISQSLTYQTYLDPIDLEPGDWEAGLYVGKLSTTFGLSPKYNGELGMTGFYRKAFIDHPAIGFGLQASQSVQQLSAETQVLVGGGRIDATVAGSRSPLGSGYLAGLVYDLLLDQGYQSTSVSVAGTYQSRFFTGLGAPTQDNTNLFNGAVTFTHSFNPQLTLQAGAAYTHNRQPLKDSYRIYTDAYYRISPKWFLRGGVDYQRLSVLGATNREDGFGFNISIVFQPTLEDRAEASYDYHFNDAQLSYQHDPSGYVGSVGYGGLLEHDLGGYAAQAYGDYVGNRFDASLTHSLAGPSFGQVTNNQVTTARVSTAFAYADGAFSVTRRIGDSFAILEPHESLRGHAVILGDLLTEPGYLSKSGPLGGAVDGYLSSYVTQSIQYDVENPPPGYDIGLGVFRVRPPYHSGYRLTVGSDAYVTAIGTLLDSTGKPVSLGGGQMIDLSRPRDKAVPFFTNSVGRFAMTSLRPNNHYRVSLYSGATFEFIVPADNKGLFDMRLVTVSGEK